MSISLAISDEEIRATFPVMHQLRPHLEEETYVQRIRKLQQTGGYRLLTLRENGQPRACAGYRVCDSLAWGTFIYVDDLITDQDSRGKGHAQQLFDWLEREAARLGCDALHLDSGVQRFDAHRFYLNQRMNITCHHFEKRYD